MNITNDYQHIPIISPFHWSKRSRKKRDMSYGMFSCGKGIVVINIMMFLYKAGEAMLDATTRPYLIRAVCYEILKTNNQGNETECSSLENHPAMEDQVQKQSGYYLIYYRLLLNIPAILLSLFCGSYSDRHGRKLPILLPCFGGMAAVMMYTWLVICCPSTEYR